MKAKYAVWALVLIALAAGGWQIDKWKRQPPEISFARVAKENITSTVPTNGKVEPELWAVARAERSGAVKEILVDRGQHVATGAELVRLDTSDIDQERVSAQSKIDQVHAEMDAISKGGRAADLADIAGSLEKARLELSNAQKLYEEDQRLLAQQAETKQKVELDRQNVEALKLQIKTLEDRKAALVVPADRNALEARLREANSALQLAQDKLRQSVVRAPVDGEIYQFDLKRGAYLNAGDAVASIGKLDRVNVNVDVDERDLGRVTKGMPVTITWDALPKREWKGAVNKLPGQIVALGSRQVGEIVCLIGNPGHELLPGTNVNAEILSESVNNVLTIPKEALRRDAKQQAGVFVLDGDHLAWKSVMVGLSNITRVQVQGLNEGDPVALISERSLKDGMPVQAVFP
ncbi:MAG TPA: efflux RND transporter periplasmic adaptor subunit [Bryobacteraceae bacterium]